MNAANVAVSASVSAVQTASALPEYPSSHTTATIPVVVVLDPVPPSILSLLLFATLIEAQVAAAA